ncbi:hypothetical protein [Nonomuraea recticatena]|uniref:hypothetical protein n=1 Tax=Nonomuraea recticatena TaxID=46178 RepID=UPI00360F14CA
MSYSPASECQMGNDLLPASVVQGREDGQTGARERTRGAVRPLRGPSALPRGKASVAALVRLLAPLEIAAPAVRTAVSRMVRQGWLDRARMPQGPGYVVTPKCVRRLDEAALRIYRAGTIKWHGRWHLIVLEPVRERARRERLRADLAFLGYAQLSETTWVGPRPSPSSIHCWPTRASAPTGSKPSSTATHASWWRGHGTSRR